MQVVFVFSVTPALVIDCVGTPQKDALHRHLETTECEFPFHFSAALFPPSSHFTAACSNSGERVACTHRCVLKVVEAVVGEDEPPPLPGLDSSPCGAEDSA